MGTERKGAKPRELVFEENVYRDAFDPLNIFYRSVPSIGVQVKFEEGAFDNRGIPMPNHQRVLIDPMRRNELMDIWLKIARSSAIQVFEAVSVGNYKFFQDLIEGKASEPSKIRPVKPVPLINEELLKSLFVGACVESGGKCEDNELFQELRKEGVIPIGSDDLQRIMEALIKNVRNQTPDQASRSNPNNT